MEKHTKHAKLIRPTIGAFGRNEVAFLGATCGTIDSVVQSISQKLHTHFEKICFVDADHKTEKSEAPILNLLQDKISFKNLSKNSINDFEQKFYLSDQNLILVNGNHFQASSQILIIDPEKESSLKKRASQISNVIAILLVNTNIKPYEWLKEYIPEIGAIPVFDITNAEEISKCIINTFMPPPLKALILTGGKSIRMGEDKAQIKYHGVSQVDYLSQIFQELNIDYYISKAVNDFQTTSNTINDKFIGLGPYGGILSAFQEDPNSGWLVLACDLPLIGKNEISHLIKKRNPNKTATAFLNTDTGFPDPLFTIYEPKAYIQLLSFLSLGYSCPRKVLINSDTEILEMPNTEFLKNANTKEDKIDILKKLS